MSARILLICCILQLVSYWNQPAVGAEGTAAKKPDRTIIVDEDTWQFNWASFDQDKLVSFGKFQYTIYWDADTVLVLVRRNLKTDKIQALRFPQHKLSRNPKDGHRNTVLGISPGDGRLHMSWDHHCNDLRYTRSRKGFLTNPPEKMSLKDFEPAQPLLPKAPQSVTYPRFLNDARENLFFMYRSGGSGSGDTVMARYDASSGKWEIVSRRLFGRAGTYKPWDNSKTRNAYLHDVLFDRNNRLHVTWVYREVARTWASNHDLHYAYSDDSGITWKNNAGVKIADLSRNDPIVLDDPGIVVYKIPVYSWLMNQCAMALDSRNQPHVATFHLPKPSPKPKKLRHGPPKALSTGLSLFHYWRDAKGVWHKSKPLVIPDRAQSGMRRPGIVIDGDDTVYIYWASRQGLRCHVAKAKDKWQTWTTFLMTGPEFTSGDACKHDRRLLREKGILSFTADPTGKKKGKGYAILDFDLKRLAATPEKKAENK